MLDELSRWRRELLASYLVRGFVRELDFKQSRALVYDDYWPDAAMIGSS